MTFDPNTFFPIAVPLTIMGMLLLKPRQARPVCLDRLWIVPVAVGGFMGMGLYFMPHAPFGPWADTAFALALAAGLAAGWAQVRSVKFNWDADAARVMTQSSIVAVLVILALFTLRAATRMVLDGPGATLDLDPGTVSDAFLIAAIGLISGGRIEIWRRGRRIEREAAA